MPPIPSLLADLGRLVQWVLAMIARNHEIQALHKSLDLLMSARATLAEATVGETCARAQLAVSTASLGQVQQLLAAQAEIDGVRIERLIQAVERLAVVLEGLTDAVDDTDSVRIVDADPSSDSSQSSAVRQAALRAAQVLQSG